MASFVRKVRAAISLTITWSVAWASAGALIGMSYLGRAPNAPGFPRGGASLEANLEAIFSIAFNMAAYGAFTGACFALFIAVSARKRTSLSAARMIGLGAIAGCGWIALGIGIPILLEQRVGIPVVVLASLPLNAGLGAVAGWISWRIARRNTDSQNPDGAQHQPLAQLAAQQELRAQEERTRDRVRTRMGRNAIGFAG